MLRDHFRITALSRSVLVLIVALGSFVLGGCGGGGGGFFVPVAPAQPVGISVTPSTATVVTGASQPFAAKVTGLSNTAVTWSLTGGGTSTLSPAGVFTAGTGATTATVKATSVANPGLSATATVTIVTFVNYSGVMKGVSPMRDARSNHTANLLPDGQILVAGGLGTGSVAIAGVELFQPGTGTFTPAANLTSTRAYHSATLLINGKVLIAGGIDSANNPLASAEIFDPATGSSVATGSMAEARWMHTATLLPNGKVLFTGGNSELGPGIIGGLPLATAEIYDPDKGTFAAAGNLTDARYNHTATLLVSGRVLLAGGYGTGGLHLSSVEVYNPTANTFTAAGNMGIGRWLHTAIAFVKNILGVGNREVVLLAGGDGGTVRGMPNYQRSTELLFYNASTNTMTFTTYTATGAMNTPRGHHTVVPLATGKNLVAGGFGGYTTAAVTLGSTEAYDPAAGTFAASTSMPAGLERANHTATMLPSGKVLITGGNNGATFLNSALLYQ